MATSTAAPAALALLTVLAVASLAARPAAAALAAASASAPSRLPRSLPLPSVKRRRFPKRFCARPKLVCKFQATAGNSAYGAVIFDSVQRGRRCVVRVRARLTGISPGEHGLHIHTYGDVRAPDGKSCGGHFNGPWNRNGQHGYPWSPRRHWGDFGNVVANAKGEARFYHLDKMIRIGHIVGRGMILHEGRDQGPLFQPSGAAGSRIARCVIGYANPEYKDDL